MNKLVIITLNWNGEDKLKKLAPTLLNSLRDVDFEWFIKDNDSKDKSIDYLQSLNNKNIHTVKYKDNKQNFSEGCNYLYQVASPAEKDYILLLNNDIVFNDTSSIKNMIKLMEQDSAIGIVGTRLLYSNTNVLQHAGIVFNRFNNLPINFRDRQNNDISAEKNRLFQAVTGAVLLTKAEYYKNSCTTNPSGIKGMDEKYQWAFDDVDLCMSIGHTMKKKVVYCGKTNIFHESSASLKKNPSNMLFIGQNIAHFRSKWLNKYTMDQDIYSSNIKHNLYKD
jgi:hypothetical protein